MLLVYETQKASSVFEAPASGILKQILIPSGGWLEVTNPVGIITI
jgi:pyruvate/2-oxoglutarate dehydrogenase complex dihydrolipoamide acyltransferase (E2) component